MDSTELMPLIGWSMMILAGGMVGSFGMNSVIKGRRARAFVRHWRWWGLAIYYVLVVGGIVAGFAWVFSLLLRAVGADANLESPWVFFTFGLAAGLPFTLPTITGVWRDERGPGPRARIKQKPATPQQRLEFAKDLERQLHEYVGDSRTIKVRTQGEKSVILFFDGDIDRQQGERLVAALRADIQALNFQRVEGQNAGGSKWWVRV